MCSNKIIFHIDVNSAYLSWEASYRINHLGGTLDLRGIPSAIGGSKDTRNGIILAKSIPAKKYNIHTGEVIWKAKQKYPSLFVAPPNYNLYEACSRAFINLLKDYTPAVEQYSIDEAYMDMSGTQNLWGNSFEIAQHIKDRIKAELGFTVNIGISTNKILAKMASDFRKPDLVHTLYPHEIKTKMWRMPVSDLFFVGNATNKRLHLLGIKTIGDLANTDLQILKKHLKKHGEIIWSFANGIDISEVLSEPAPNKGYGNSLTIPYDVYNAETAKLILLSLCETVCTRLRKDNVKAEVISIGIKDIDFNYHSHQRVISSATNCTLEIHRIVCSLFEELWNGSPIRHLGVHTTRICKDSFKQMDFFDMDYSKYEANDRAIDEIREKYGDNSVQRASFVNTPLVHMSGGISNDKKSVDYSQIDII